MAEKLRWGILSTGTLIAVEADREQGAFLGTTRSLTQDGSASA